MKNRVRKTDLPMNSILQKRIGKSDFVDCFVVNSTLPARKAAEVVVQFPKWGRALVFLRKILTAPFGLSNDGPMAEDKVGPFPVELDTDEEFIAGFNDKHLNFRISVISQSGQVYLGTWVHTHNIGGKLYLGMIYPFHVMIARNALKRVAALQA